jgi:hypothetical protein
MQNSDQLDALTESAINVLASYIQNHFGKNEDSNSYVSDNRLFDIVKHYVKKESAN